MSDTQLFDDVTSEEKVKPKRVKAAVDANDPPNLGKAIRLPVPDFSDPNRKPTCLEVDFPIGPINALSKLEGNAGKPIYQMSKWWARRRSSVFRSLLIAAATEAPDDHEQAQKRVWDHYYSNHQKAGSFKKLKVLEPFMGGGTTVVEGARLGFQVTGIDLNPVAWFVTKNEVACSDPAQVKALFDRIEVEVKPLIQPFYTTTCPRGHKGRWIDVRTNTIANVDPIDLPPEERKHYRWEGPEVIYTFWTKHGPCGGSQGKPCGHRTPIFKSPIVAEKKLSAAYIPIDCPHCGHHFDAELGETRMAPGAERVVLDTEPSFTELSQTFAFGLARYNDGNSDERRDRIGELLAAVDTEPGLCCPSCKKFAGQQVHKVLYTHQRATRVGDLKKKDFGIESHPVFMYLLVHPRWFDGTPGKAGDGTEFGGYAGAAPDATAAWWKARLDGLSLVEVRGRVKLSEDPTAAKDEAQEAAVAVDADDQADVEADGDEPRGDEVDRKQFGPPALVTLRDGTVISTRKGTVPRKSAFTCQGCGTAQDILGAVQQTGRTAPVMPCAVQCHCPDCELAGYTYGGRFFKELETYDVERLWRAERCWSVESQSRLVDLWPTEPIPYSVATHVEHPIHLHGYTHWSMMFNSRQLYVHSSLLAAIRDFAKAIPVDVTYQALGAFQQYLRNQNMFCIWDIGYDKLAPMMSNGNYHPPKQQVVENCVFHRRGRGNWSSCSDKVIEALEWVKSPWELVILDKGEGKGGKKSIKVATGDPLEFGQQVLCGSSTDLSPIVKGLFDLVITDPPYDNRLYYADLADFFYFWLRKPMQQIAKGTPDADYFNATRSPHATEALGNPVENPDDRLPYEREPLVSARHLPEILKASGDASVQLNDPNPLYRREPASEFYCNTLTACWSEASRLLKDGGLMAFTFHHAEDSPWVDVLESLFNSGFFLTATYPIRSDEMKGSKGQFGSKKIEYDILHICRKRLAAVEPVAWAKMRRWVKDESARYKALLEHVHGGELLEADMLVILRGKALEFYSRHYGKVLTGDGQVLGVRDALLGINQLLDDLMAGEGAGARKRPPDAAEPASRLFLSLFMETDRMARDALHKTLRGTGFGPDDLAGFGWVRIVGTKVHAKPIAERYVDFRVPGRTRKNMLKTDLDQAQFLIGCAMDPKGPDIGRELDGATFVLKRSVDAILGWYAATAHEEVRDAAAMALRLVSAWRNKPKTLSQAQMTLFAKLDQEVA
jgi:hypothetical protein